MSRLIKNNATKKSLSTTITTTTKANVLNSKSFITKNKHPIIKTTTAATATRANNSTSSSLTGISSMANDVSPSSSLGVSLFSMMEKQPIELPQATLASLGSGRKVFKTMPSSFKIMSYQNIIALVAVLVFGLATVNGLKCYMCGQYNEGVGSITPCLNYSEQYAHLYLKECSKKSEKYCVKYVSELSIVRDCATECAEKEIWETQTYCCTEDGCNGSSTVDSSAIVVAFPLVIFIINKIIKIIKQQLR